MFVPGNFLYNDDESQWEYCFLPILYQNLTDQDTWFLGSPILNDYYTVFDMSGEPQIGFAKINPVNTIGEQYFEEYLATNMQTLMNLHLVLWVVIGLSLIVLLSMYLLYLCRKSSELKRTKKEICRLLESTEASQYQKQRT